MNTDKECSLAPIYDITPFSALDFTGKLSAIIWFSGCNLRCSYCYNPHIVFGHGSICVQDALGFLKKRQGLLDGVVMSGGEPTMYEGLLEFCKCVKALGFAVKLDTNGMNPMVLSKLQKENLLDFVSLDFKSTKEKWATVAVGGSFNAFANSLNFLIAHKTPFEVRTTIHPSLLNSEDLQQMSDFLHAHGYVGKHFVQAYRHTKTIGHIDEPKNGWIDDFNKNSSLVWR